MTSTHLSMSHEGKDVLRQIVEATGKIVPSHHSAWLSTNVSDDDWLAVLDYAAALEAERDELRAALEPFADVGDYILAEAPPEATMFTVFTDFEGNTAQVSLEYFRRARVALAVLAKAEEA